MGTFPKWFSKSSLLITVRDFRRPNWSKKINSPTLLLSATEDQLVDSKKNEEICQTIPEIDIAKIKGRHELLMEKDHIRKETWQHIDKFLNKYLWKSIQNFF